MSGTRPGNGPDDERKMDVDHTAPHHCASCEHLRNEFQNLHSRSSKIEDDLIKQKKRTKTVDEQHNLVSRKLKETTRQLKEMEANVATLEAALNERNNELEHCRSELEHYRSIEAERVRKQRELEELRRRKRPVFFQDSPSAFPSLDQLAEQHDIFLGQADAIAIAADYVGVIFYAIYRTARLESVNLKRERLEELKNAHPRCNVVILALTPGSPNTVNAASQKLDSGEAVITLWFNSSKKQFISADAGNGPQLQRLREIIKASS